MNMFIKEVIIAARVHILLRKIRAGMKNSSGTNSSPKSIQGKYSVSPDDGVLAWDITTASTSDTSVSISIIAMEILRIRKNLNFISTKPSHDQSP